MYKQYIIFDMQTTVNRENKISYNNLILMLQTYDDKKLSNFWFGNYAYESFFPINQRKAIKRCLYERTLMM